MAHSSLPFPTFPNRETVIGPASAYLVFIYVFCCGPVFTDQSMDGSHRAEVPTLYAAVTRGPDDRGLIWHMAEPGRSNRDPVSVFGGQGVSLL